MSPLELARLHLDTMYEFDARGRIVAGHDADGPPPPRFVLARTSEGVLALAGASVADATAAALLDAAREEPPLGGDPEKPPAGDRRYRALLAAEAPVERESAGPAFLLPDDLAAPDGVTEITAAYAGLLDRHFPWAHEERPPVFVAVEDGAAVAICRTVTRPGPAVEAGVETVEAYRGRGHATRVTTAWARATAAEGVLPLYSTWWANTASRRVAVRLGGRLYAVDHWLA